MSRVAHSSCTKYYVKKWLWCCLLTELFNKYLYRSLSPLAISRYLLGMKTGRGLSPGALSWDEYSFIPIDDHLGLNIRAMQVPFTLLLTVRSLTLDPCLSLNHDHFMVETCACFWFACLVMCVREIWWESRTPHCPLYQIIQTSSIQGILLVTPEGLWGLDKLQDLFQRVWLEKWQLSVNSHPLRKQSSGRCHGLSACGWHIQWEVYLPIKSIVLFQQKLLEQLQLWWQLEYCQLQYHCSWVKGDGLIVG